MEKMNKHQAKQKLFEIIEKYQNGTITEDDVKILTEIIANNNPYLNTDYNIPISFDKLPDDDKKTNAYFSNEENKIVVNIEYLQKLFLFDNKQEKISLIDYINTIFHELRHCDQFKNPDAVKQDVDSEKFEKILEAVNNVYAEKNKYTKEFVGDFVNLFKEGFHGDFLDDFSDEENIEDIVEEITDSFYLRDACEFDARQASIKVSRGFIKDIFHDKDAPKSIKDWCRSDAESLQEIEETENRDNKMADHFNKKFHNLPIKPKDVKNIINNINMIAGILESDVETDRTEKVIEARDKFQYSCRQCVKHLFKNKTLDELVNYYIVALVHPNLYAINIEKGNVSLANLNNDIVIRQLQLNLSQKLEECSPEKRAEISKKILKVAKLPVVLTSLTKSLFSLNLLTMDDKKSLLTHSICSYIHHFAIAERCDYIKEILNSFDPNHPQDCKHIETILSTYKNTLSTTFSETESSEEKIIKLKKINLLKSISKRLNLPQLMEKFGKSQEFEEIINQKPNLSTSERFNLNQESDKMDPYKINSAIYGKTYAKIMQAKDKTIKLSEYNTDKNFIENSENAPATL